jgi:hypothetical protein
MLVLAATFARAADMTDAQLYAEAPKGLADQAKPVFLKYHYLRKGEFEMFKRVLSKEARAFVDQQIAKDRDYLAKLQKWEKSQPFDEKTTVSEVRSNKAVDQEMAEPSTGEHVKKGIEGVFLSTGIPNQDRGPEFVVKEGGFWRIAKLDGMPESTIMQNVPKK